MADDQCCPDDYGGSHYHCPYCGCSCSMMGHLDVQGNPKWCPPPEKRPTWAKQFVTVEPVTTDLNMN